jgi:hypothetical protein
MYNYSVVKLIKGDEKSTVHFSPESLFTLNR